MINIILIGCGNIGARHLQSLCQLNLSAEFHIVDPNFKNIQNAIDISNSKNNRVIHSYRNINELPNKIDLLIVAYAPKMGFAPFNKLKETLIFKIMNIIKEAGSDFAYPSSSLYVESMPKN